MDISYDWLTQYVTHELAPEELAEVLTMGGLEVDGVESIGQSFDHVVVGRVAEVHDHPNADRLVLCQVDVGESEMRQIACGAPNVAANQRVPVALEGAIVRVPDREDPETYISLTIQKTKLRGETSEGMICAEDELGLSEDHSGIMVLAENATVGQPFADYLREQKLPPQDTIYDIDLTPNRPDATSHIGVARDVAALTKHTLNRPEVPVGEPGGEAANQITVDIKDPEGCPRYVALVVRNVTVEESPPWLQHRLRSIGLRPRNNIVDITNFVMHECGQPLHAFDLDQLAGPGIVVRRTNQEESFTTLDDVERTLPKDTVMICDAEKPVAVAGIMGGQNSEVGETTTNVLIESAYFDPTIIRQTAKALQLSTDSSYRFERGVDPEQQEWAAARAAQLMVELGSGELVPGMVDKSPNPVARTTVTVRPQRVADLLGVDLNPDRVANYLDAVGCKITVTNEETFRCTVPSFRPDITREVDLIEEVARLYGYNNISKPGRSQLPNQPPARETNRRLRTILRDRLAGLGFREIYTNSMLSEKVAQRFMDHALTNAHEEASIVETLNPISREMAALRPSLLPGMLDVMSHNQHHGQDVLRFMEFGHVFWKSAQQETLIQGYHEQPSLILGLSGPAQPTNWDTETRQADFYDLKGVVETLTQILRLDNLKTVSYPEKTPTALYRLELYINETYLGVVARLQDELGEDYDLPHPMFFAEFNLHTLLEHATPPWSRRYKAVSRFPRVHRDLAVVVAQEQSVNKLIESIKTVGAPLLQQVDIFDLYEGEHIPEGQKSIGFSLEFGANHTLVDKEVDKEVRAIVEELASSYNATLRQ